MPDPTPPAQFETKIIKAEDGKGEPVSNQGVCKTQDISIYISGSTPHGEAKSFEYTMENPNAKSDPKTSSNPIQFHKMRNVKYILEVQSKDEITEEVDPKKISFTWTGPTHNKGDLPL
jgi:hypothetical protein